MAERAEVSRSLPRVSRSASSPAALPGRRRRVSREIKGNNGPTRYRAVDQASGRGDGLGGPGILLAQRPSLAQFADRMAEDCSPEQISGHLATVFTHDPAMQVSHETIYNTLFVQSWGVLAKDSRVIRRRGDRSGAAFTAEGRACSGRSSRTSFPAPSAPLKQRAVLPGHWTGRATSFSAGGSTQIAAVVERAHRASRCWFNSRDATWRRWLNRCRRG